MFEICLKLKIGISGVTFEQISQIVLLFPLLTFSKLMLV